MDAIEICIEEAKKSNMCSKHGAILIYRNKILAYSHNIAPTSNKNLEKHERFSKDGKRRISGCHAEISVIKKFVIRYPKRWLSKCTMIVIRVNNSDNLINSKPCDYCKSYIEKHNIPSVYFSSNSA